MKRLLGAVVALLLVVAAVMIVRRVVRVSRAAAAIPVYAGAREGGGRTRYFRHLISWDDPSSARVERVFALPEAVNVVRVARNAEPILLQHGWYRVTPDDFEERAIEPQVVIWQRDPDERLDLTRLWPLEGMSRTTRLYGGIFPREFLDAPLVVEWSWALGGHRVERF